MKRLLAPLGFALVVIATNALTNLLGVVTCLGVTATAGTWLAGFAFVARDVVHESLGGRWVLGCILVGAAISAAFSPALALASATAFLLSEGVDYAVYQPLRRRGQTIAALSSNLAGSIVDSIVFLLIAGFPLALVWSQVGIKYATTTAFVLALGGCRALFRQPIFGAGGGRHA